MDESSKNDTGIEQKPTPTPEAPHYQEYLNSEDENKSKKRRKLLIIAGIILAIIVAGVVITFLLIGRGEDKQASRQAISICEDESCFTQKFSQCLLAEYTYSVADVVSVKYKIQGFGEIGCSMEMSYISSKYQPDIQGKSMACDFDNTIVLDSAVQNVMDYPDDYECKGDLADFLKTSTESNAI